MCAHGHAGPGEDLTWLGILPKLTQLTLINVIDEDNMEAVHGLKSLRSLTLRGPCTELALCDDAISDVSSMTQLEELRIERSAATNKGIRAIRNLTQLRRLELLYLPHVTADGLASIGFGNLKQLRVLKLRTSVVGSPLDDVLDDVRSLKQIEVVAPGGGITDIGLLHLSALKTLRVLDLSGSKGFTDEALSRLVESLPNLRTLTLP